MALCLATTALAVPVPQTLGENVFFAGLITAFEASYEAAIGKNTTGVQTPTDALKESLLTTSRIGTSITAGNAVEMLFKDDVNSPARYVAAFVARLASLLLFSEFFPAD